MRNKLGVALGTGGVMEQAGVQAGVQAETRRLRWRHMHFRELAPTFARAGRSGNPGSSSPKASGGL